METFTLDKLSKLKGKDVRSADGEKIGSVKEIFYDETTNTPEWIGLGTGFLGLKHAVVPVEGAVVEDDCVCVPYAKEYVTKEPEFDEDEGFITPESEQRLIEHFSLPSTATRTDRHVGRYDRF